jgi:hypothetical protein
MVCDQGSVNVYHTERTAAGLRVGQCFDGCPQVIMGKEMKGAAVEVERFE